jgi:hypothetical protein
VYHGLGGAKAPAGPPSSASKGRLGSWASLRCKIAAWLIIPEIIWTANRLVKHGLPHNKRCFFFNYTEEDPQHLCGDQYNMQFISQMAGFAQVAPFNNQKLKSW